MNTTIKNDWYTLKKEYEEKYNEKIFTNYENSKPYVEKFKLYLEEKYKEDPTNVDVVCALATIMQELRNDKKSIKLLDENSVTILDKLRNDKKSIKLLEDFMRTYENELSDNNKARIYTNLAYYYSDCSEEIKYLLESEKLESPFFETYNGLGQYYFSKYQFEDNKECLAKSLIAFEKSLKFNASYSMKFNCGVCLFELKQYEKARELFKDLLIQNPNRMRLLLSIAYCEIYLGNKEKALEYLKQVKTGQDENYHLNTDDISDYQIYDAYYVLEEYELFLKEYETIVYTRFFNEISYYYVLFITKRYQKLDEVLEKDKKQILFYIEETKLDEDFKDEEERIAYINSYQEDLEILIETENKIKNENYKPIGKLELYPEFGCYLVDCIRHSS